MRKVEYEIDLSAEHRTFLETARNILPLTLVRLETDVFEVTDEGGKRIPSLTHARSDDIASAILEAALRGLIANPTDRILAAITELPYSRPSNPLESIQATTDVLDHSSIRNGAFLRLVMDLTRNRLALIAPPSNENFVYLQYTETRFPSSRPMTTDVFEPPFGHRSISRRGIALARQASSQLGLTATSVSIPMPSLTVAEHWSLSFEAPAGTHLDDGFVEYEDISGREVLVEADVKATRLTCWGRGTPFTRRVRLSVAFWIAPAWLAWAAVNGLAIAVMLVAGAFRLPHLLETPIGTPQASPRSLAVTVILASVAGGALVLSRPSEEDLAARFLRGPRLTLQLLGALAFSAAGTLVFGPAGFSLRVTWFILAALAVLLSVPLIWAWILSVGRRKQRAIQKEAP